MKGARRLCQKHCLDALTAKDNCRIIRPDLTTNQKEKTMMWALVLWTAVAGSSGDRVMDWRVLTQHRTLELCHRAAHDLGKTPNQYRCIRQENDLPLRDR